jgi:hypothetical protein
MYCRLFCGRGLFQKGSFMEPANSAPAPGRGRSVGTVWARLTWGQAVTSCLGISAVLWLIFYPGLLSFDSIQQYKQAREGDYNDAHPPLLAVALRGMFTLGGDIQHLMFVQCLVGVFGVYLLAYQTLRFAQAEPGRARLGALVVLGALLTPLSPLALHLMTFWKDVWLLIALCWLLALALWLYRSGRRAAPAARAVALGLFLALVPFAVMARHNAVVLVPVLSVVFAWLVGRSFGLRWYKAAPALLLPGLLYTGANHRVYQILQVKHFPLENCLIAQELVTVCAASPKIQQELTYTSQYLTPDFRQHFIPGRSDTLTEKVISPMLHHDINRMFHDYWHVVRHHPLAMVSLKLHAFSYHFREKGYAPFEAYVCANEFNLKIDSSFPKTREWMVAKLLRNFHHPIHRWFFTKHLVWFVVTVATFLTLVAAAWRARSKQRTFLALVVLIPLSYSLGFAIVSFCGDFRYLYPSSLCAQVVTLAVGLEVLYLTGRRIAVAVASLGRRSPAAGAVREEVQGLA